MRSAVVLHFNLKAKNETTLELSCPDAPELYICLEKSDLNIDSDLLDDEDLYEFFIALIHEFTKAHCTMYDIIDERTMIVLENPANTLREGIGMKCVLEPKAA